LRQGHSQTPAEGGKLGNGGATFRLSG
jgi:hypothetical protein